MADITSPNEYIPDTDQSGDWNQPGAGPMGAASNPVGALSMMMSDKPQQPQAQQMPQRGLTQDSMGALQAGLTSRIRSPEVMQQAATDRRGALTALQEAQSAPANDWSFAKHISQAMSATDKPWDVGYGFRQGVSNAMQADKDKQLLSRQAGIDNAKAQMAFNTGEEGISSKEEKTALDDLSKIASASARTSLTANSGIIHTPQGIFKVDPTTGNLTQLVGKDDSMKIAAQASAQASREASTQMAQGAFKTVEEMQAHRDQRAKELFDQMVMTAGGKNTTPAQFASPTSAQPANGSVSSVTPLPVPKSAADMKIPPAAQAAMNDGRTVILRNELSDEIARPVDESKGYTQSVKDANIAALNREITGTSGAQKAPATTTPIGNKLSPDAIENAAARYNIDRSMPTLGMGAQAAINRSAIINRAAELAAANGDDKTAQATLQIGNHANAQALAQLTKQQTMVGAFERNANKNADMALALSDQVDRTGVPILNAWIQAGQKSVEGNPKLAQFHAANETFVNEYAKIMSGSMGNTPVSDAARVHAHSLLSTAQNKYTYQAVMSTLKQEMANRMAGFDEQKASLMGSMVPKQKSSGAISLDDYLKSKGH